MMMSVAGVIGALGLVSILSRKTLLGVLIGIQILMLGASMMFVLAGISSGVRIEGHAVGFFVIIGGVAQLVAGYTLAIRMFYLKNKTEMQELRSLKQ